MLPAANVDVPLRGRDASGIGARDTASSESGRARSSCRRLFIRFVDVVFPWVLAMLIGAFTSVTGTYIAMNCDFFSDIRFGRCKGFYFKDRNRCCGGADNINQTTGRCIQPEIVVGSPRGIVDSSDWVPWEDNGTSLAFVLYLVISIALSGVAAFIVFLFAPKAKGSGFPDVRAAVSGFAVSHSFSAACLVVKSLGLSMVVGAGLALGKEGPMIHIGVCWAFVLRSSTSPLAVLAGAVPLYEMVCVGAAAGVATAFGAPIGGVLFAVEELGSVRALSQRALLLTFAGSFTASFVLKSFNLYGSNQLTFFALSTPANSPTKEWLTWEISVFVFLGAMGGIIGSLFIHLNLAAAKRRKAMVASGRLWLLPTGVQDRVLRWLPYELRQTVATSEGPSAETPPKLNATTLHVVELMLIALLSCIFNYPVRLLRLPMVEVIHGLFETCPSNLGANLRICDEHSPHGFGGLSLQFVLFVSIVVRFLESVATFGSMIPAGIFIPSLYFGAALGRLVGLWTLALNIGFVDKQDVAHMNPSAFAMVGSVAMLSGVARTTVSLVVIMLELTGELNYVVPFMCSVLTAKLVGDSFSVSIYDAHGGLLGYAVIEEPKGLRLAAQVSDIALPCSAEDILDVSGPIPIGDLRALFDRASLAHARQTVLGDTGASDEEFEDGARPNAHRERLRVLVLQRGTGQGEICGVVDRGTLGRWLEGCPDADGEGALCAFDAKSVQAIMLGSPGRQPVVDLQELVDSRFRQLLASAPVLTAVCAFREYPDLGYCVCHGEADGSVSVLSRDGLGRALTDGRFPAAFRDPDVPDAALSPRARGVSMLERLRRWCPRWRVRTTPVTASSWNNGMDGSPMQSRCSSPEFGRSSTPAGVPLEPLET
mmetsp:Transcript_77211/g.214701  ORF Transcript_77211/g.214701 Transcript_77211/m.214701 type:complete len:880 (-) Transcript_77211:8-2647(-)